MSPSHTNFRPPRRTIGARLAVLGAAVIAGAATAGDDLAITSWTVDGGGGQSIGSTFTLTGTIGQPDASTAMNGATLDIAGGFWTFGPPSGPPCPADISGNGQVDFQDLLAVLSAFGVCEGCPEDLDDDDAVGFSDLLIVLSSWGPCPS